MTTINVFLVSFLIAINALAINWIRLSIESRINNNR